MHAAAQLGVHAHGTHCRHADFGAADQEAGADPRHAALRRELSGQSHFALAGLHHEPRVGNAERAQEAGLGDRLDLLHRQHLAIDQPRRDVGARAPGQLGGADRDQGLPRLELRAGEPRRHRRAGRAAL